MLTMRVRVLAIVATSFLAGAASAVDLMELYREAKSADARYGAAQAQFRAALEAVPQARATAAREARLDSAVKRHRHRGVAWSHDFSSGGWHRYRSELLRPSSR